MTKVNRPFRNSIAHRELSVEGSRKKVKVEIGKPFDDDNCFVCQYRFVFGKTEIRWHACGVDPFQALELALKIIPTELRTRKALPLGKMYAFETGDDMGFPEVYK